MMFGIADSLIASILYAAGRGIWTSLNDPLANAIEKTILYFYEEKQIELRRESFEALLNGELGDEINKFRDGDSFIEGEKLAYQFALFGDLYLGDESKEIKVANEIFSYFKEALTGELLKDKRTSIQTLSNIQNIQFEISQEGRDKILKEVQRIIDNLEKEDKEKEIEKSIIAKYEDFRIIDADFWDGVREHTDKKYLYLYYTNTDSSPVRITDVVANDWYIKNDKVDRTFEGMLRSVEKNSSKLIKILSRAGEGKSTFLWHIAKKYSSQFNVVVLEKISKEVFIRIEQRLSQNAPNLPLLILLDNPSICGEDLVILAPKLISGFRSRGLTLVVSEREFRYKNIEDVEVFENNFNNVHSIEYKSNHLRSKIFNKLFKLFQTEYEVPEELREKARSVYLRDVRKSTSECTYAVIKYLKSVSSIKFTFDWEDWEKFTTNKEPGLKNLYLILATFYQFGFSLQIDFCAKFMEGVKSIDIIQVLGESYNLPIYRRSNRLFLRHETIASWYLDNSEEATRKNRICSEMVFKEFLEEIRTDFERNLLIWIYKNNDFQDSYLADYLSIEKRADILRNYIKKNKKELKCRTELAKIYQHQGKYDEAE
ncbi:MAG: hypothetical protein QQN60_08075, partial [Nitrosopumilus sp.]